MSGTPRSARQRAVMRGTQPTAHGVPCTRGVQVLGPAALLRLQLLSLRRSWDRSGVQPQSPSL
eukprot:6467464-Prorocentrum_lima.AAC.1